MPRSTQKETAQVIQTSTPKQNVLTAQEFQNALTWNRTYGNMEISMPRLRSSQRMKIQEQISKYWEHEAVPKLERFIDTKLGTSEEERWNAIDGAISKIEYRIV
jgi:hypothetical protein